MAAGIVVLIWMASMAIASLQLVVSRSEEQNVFGYIYMDCREKWGNEASRHVYTVVIALCTYFIPLVLLAYVYIKIGISLWERQLPGNANTTRDNILLKSKRKVRDFLSVLTKNAKWICVILCGYPQVTSGSFPLLAQHKVKLMDSSS